MYPAEGTIDKSIALCYDFLLKVFSHNCIKNSKKQEEKMTLNKIVTFDALFKKLTGMHPDDAQVGEDGFLFIPFSAEFSQKLEGERELIVELAGPNGWRNHLVNDEYAGWWIRRPA